MLLHFNTIDEKKLNDSKSIVLAGDVGATKCNLTMYETNGQKVSLLKKARYKSNEYKNITELVEDFVANAPIPNSVCFGVAGPVLNGRAKLSNIMWEIDTDELSAHLGIEKVFLINDLEATAYGLAMIDEKDTAVLHEPSEMAVGNAAIVAPGTGLGEAGIYWNGKHHHPFATEGGHCDFAPRDQFDFDLYTWLHKKYDHVSWERLLCGPGIVNIYEFLRDEKKRKEPAWLKTEFANTDAARVISENVGVCDICTETMQLFIRYLAYESANLVLKLKATGGLFIGGGIAPQIVSLFASNNFHELFLQSGRLNYLLEKVPVRIILNDNAALLGAAYYGMIQ